MEGKYPRCDIDAHLKPYWKKAVSVFLEQQLLKTPSFVKSVSSLKWARKKLFYTQGLLCCQTRVTRWKSSVRITVPQEGVEKNWLFLLFLLVILRNIPVIISYIGRYLPTMHIFSFTIISPVLFLSFPFFFFPFLYCFLSFTTRYISF